MCWAVPFKDTFQFGADEGCELLKGFMCSKGFLLYKDMWNDQPPLYTLLLSTLFKCVGPTLLGARLLALGSGTLLFFTFFNLVRFRSGIVGAIAGVLFLLVSPTFLDLSVSVMLEVPAFAIALLATWALFHWRERQRNSWLLISGLTMGCALQIKFTAGMLMPAMIVEMILGATAGCGRSKLRIALRDCGIWFVGLCLTFITIGVLSGENIPIMWASHTTLGVDATMGKPLDFRFSVAEFDQHFEALVGTVLGVVVVLLRKQWRQVAFPLALLITSVMVHMFHRPYWYYYYLHLLLPMAWISGYAVEGTFKKLLTRQAESSLAQKLEAIGFATVGTCLLILLLLEGGIRLCKDVDSLAAQPKVQDDKMLSKILEYREGTKWFYPEDYIYGFHARLPVPPPLVVLPRKRFWSGQITAKQLLDYVRDYHPELVLIAANRERRSVCEVSAGPEYVVVFDDGVYRLYVSEKLLSALHSKYSR